MDREQLLALDKPALVDFLLAAYALIAKLEARIAEQDERIAALEQELAESRQPPKTPDNSSIPPSQAAKPNRAERRRAKHGARRGHPGVSRVRAEPDEIVHCRPGACRRCGQPLVEAGQREVGRSQVTELPVLVPKLVEARRYAATCAACGVETAAEYPPGFEPKRVFGPRLEARLRRTGVLPPRPPPIVPAAGRGLSERAGASTEPRRDRQRPGPRG